MLTFDQCQRLTRLRETTPDRADEVSLFYNPLTGDHRLIVRELHRRTGADWLVDNLAPKRIIASASVEQVARHFGVPDADARLLLDLAREEADGA